MLTRHSPKFIAALGAAALATSTLMTSTVAAETPDRDDGSSTARFSMHSLSFPTDPRFTQLLGINDRNVIAGYHGDMMTENTPNKGFTLVQPTTFTDENFPSSVQTQVVGIDNTGDTVGFFIDQGGNTHGFSKRKDREATQVDLPGTTFNQLLGINNKDQAAGYFQDAAGLQHAYVHEGDGTFVVLNIRMPSSQATSINDRGTVVGFEQSSPAATTSTGYMLRGNKLTELNFPGSTFTQALGINNADDVVGSYTDAIGATHGFLYQDGRYESIDMRNATSTVVNGINNDDHFVGFFVVQNADNTTSTIGLIGDRKR